MTPEALSFLNSDTRVFDTLDWIAARRAKRLAPDGQAAVYAEHCGMPTLARSYTLAELRAAVDPRQCDADSVLFFLDSLDA